MNSRTVDPGSASSGTQNLLDAASGHGCINMVKDTSVVTRAKYYGLLQPDLGKEPAPPKSPLRIKNPMDKPKVLAHIPKGVLKCLGHNPNARSAQNYSIV